MTVYKKKKVHLTLCWAVGCMPPPVAAGTEGSIPPLGVLGRPPLGVLGRPPPGEGSCRRVAAAGMIPLASGCSSFCRLSRKHRC